MVFFLKSSNRKKGIIIAVYVFFFVLCSFAGEQSEDQEEKKSYLKYDSTTAFSLVLTKGNNDNFSYSLDTDHLFAFGRNNINLKGRLIQAQSDREKKSDLYYSHLKYDRQISKKAYLLSFFRFERNKLAGYEYRLALSVGGGCSWVKKENMLFSSEAAIGWNNEDTKQRINLQNVKDTNSIIEKSITASFWSALMIHKWDFQLNSSAKITLQETVFINLEDLLDYRTNSYAGVTASINKHFALNTSIQIIYERKPVPGYKHTDTYLLSSFVVKI